MAFRADKDALLARADALQREKDRLEASLDSATEERDELRASLAAHEKQLAKLKAKLARYEAKEQGAGASKATPAAVMVAVLVALAAGAVMVVLSKAAPTPPPPEPPPAPAVAEPPPPPPPEPVPVAAVPMPDPAEVRVAQLLLLRGCLDETDLELRSLTADEHAARFKNQLGRTIDACETPLRRVLVDGLVVEGVEAQVAAYVDALGAWRPVVVELVRYYKEEDYKDDRRARERELRPEHDRLRAAYMTASDELRAALAPVLAADREAQIAAARADGQDQRADMLELGGLTAAFIDAVVAPEASLPDIEARLEAMSAFRRAHPELERQADLIGGVFKHAKELVREMRSKKTVRLDGHRRFVFGFVAGYYRSSRLGARLPRR